jgi:hypothetical protein
MAPVAAGGHGLKLNAAGREDHRNQRPGIVGFADRQEQQERSQRGHADRL